MSFFEDMAAELLDGALDYVQSYSRALDTMGRSLLPSRSRLRLAAPLVAPFAGPVFPAVPGGFIPIGKDGFQVSVNVQEFQPNEITVKTVENQIVVEAKHEEREDHHGTISRQITRKFWLPQGYDPDHVTSSLSSDGILTVKAPKPTESSAKERTIEIQHTGPAHLSVKPNSQEADEKQHEEKPSAHHEKNHQKK